MALGGLLICDGCCKIAINHLGLLISCKMTRWLWHSGTTTILILVTGCLMTSHRTQFANRLRSRLLGRNCWNIKYTTRPDISVIDGTICVLQPPTCSVFKPSSTILTYNPASGLSIDAIRRLFTSEKPKSINTRDIPSCVTPNMHFTWNLIKSRLFLQQVDPRLHPPSILAHLARVHAQYSAHSA